MGVVINNSIKSSIITYLGIVIGAFNTLWLLPYCFSPEQIGLLRLLLDIPLLFSYFLQLSAPSVCDRYFQYFKNKEEKPMGFLPFILGYPLLAFIVFLIVYLLYHQHILSIFESKSPIVMAFALFVVPLTLLLMYISILEAYLRAYFNILFTTFLREVVLRLFFMLAAILFYNKTLDMNGVVWLYVLAYAISFVAIVLYLVKQKLFNLKVDFSHLPQKLFKEILWYILFMVPGTAGAMIIQKMDSLMLGSMKGLTHVAVYSIAFFIGTVVEVPKKTMNQISIPILSKASKENNWVVIAELYIKSALVQFLAGSTILLLIWINVDDILSLIPNPEAYREGKYVILLIGLAKIADMITSINAEIIQYSKYYKVNSYATFMLVIATILLNIWLIPLYNVIGAALAILIVVLGVNTFRTYYLYHRQKILPFSSKMWIVLVFMLACLAIAPYLPHSHKGGFAEILMYIFMKSAVLLACTYLLVRKFKISSDLLQLMDKVENKFKWK
jgi:O-antigen/teichoic acid export membrane protein